MPACLATLSPSQSREPVASFGLDRGGDDAIITVMQAMADPKKTAAVYFAMVEARPIDDGRLSDRDLVEAEELCRALGQEGLTEEERYAVAHLALPHGRTKPATA